MLKMLKIATAGFVLAMGLAVAPAQATLLSFGVTGVGSYTVNTGDITALTTFKTLPATELVGGTTTPAAFALAGLVTGAPVGFSTLTLHTFLGPDPLLIFAGLEVFGFTDVVSATIVPSGATTNGSISLQFNGTVIGDGSVGTVFLGQTVSFSETCTQTSIGASITCSESIRTPGVPVTVPEPMSLALVGIGLIAFGFTRRRKSS